MKFKTIAMFFAWKQKWAPKKVAKLYRGVLTLDGVPVQIGGWYVLEIIGIYYDSGDVWHRRSNVRRVMRDFTTCENCWKYKANNRGQCSLHGTVLFEECRICGDYMSHDEAYRRVLNKADSLEEQLRNQIWIWNWNPKKEKNYGWVHNWIFWW